MKTIVDPRYIELIQKLKFTRMERQLTQTAVAKKLGRRQSYIAKAEGLQRRLDIIELCDWLIALDSDPISFLQCFAWLPEKPP